MFNTHFEPINHGINKKLLFNELKDINSLDKHMDASALGRKHF